MRIRHLFLHSGNSVLGVLMHAVTVQGGADTQKELERVTEIVAVVAVERIGAVVDGELGAESDINSVAVRQIADITNRITADRKDARFIGEIENQLVSGFFHELLT